MNEWHFRPLYCTVRLYWANNMNFAMNQIPGAESGMNIIVSEERNE